MSDRHDPFRAVAPRDEGVQQVRGQWFYQTREGRAIGPFATADAAREHLKAYELIHGNRLFDEQSLQRIDNLTLE